MLLRDGKAIKSRKASRRVPCFHVDLRPDASDEFRLPAFRWKHPGQEEQVARLYRFRVDAERLRRLWKLEAKFVLTAVRRWKDESHPRLRFCLSNWYPLIFLQWLRFYRPSCQFFAWPI